jgi:hypothetical protein
MSYLTEFATREAAQKHAAFLNGNVPADRGPPFPFTVEQGSDGVFHVVAADGVRCSNPEKGLH